MAVSAALFVISAIVILAATILFWLCLGQRCGPHWRGRFGPAENPSPSLEAFRRHSGDLLTVIQDPDVLAWQLFSKHVISNSIVEEICLPTITPVQKKNRLLTAVRDHIAVNPAGLDTFLEVLKEQPYLMDIAQTLEETYAGELTPHMRVIIPRWSLVCKIVQCSSELTSTSNIRIISTWAIFRTSAMNKGVGL